MSELMFEGQREGEEVEFVFRRHLATTTKGVWFLILMVALGVIPMLIWQGDMRMFWIFLGCVAVGLIGLFYAWMLWYFSMYIVTNERIRQINQKGLFKKSVVDLSLDKIQSISYGVPGVMGGIFGFGTILIQTAVGDLVISQVAKPEQINNQLQDAVKKAEGNR